MNIVTFLPLSNRSKQWLTASIVLCWSRTSETVQLNLVKETFGCNTTQLLEVIIISVLLLCLWLFLHAFMKGSCAAWLPKDCKLCSGVALCVCYNTKETVSITNICRVFKSNEAGSWNSVFTRARVRLSVASLFAFILTETTRIFRILDTLNACMILPAKERGCGLLLISIVFWGEQHY